MADTKPNGYFQLGTVIDQGADGFEPETAGLGWVCVALGHAKAEKYWMRLVQPYASKEFGVALYPEVGDQVLTVKIGRGEYMCLGSVYTGKNVAKVSNDEGNKYGDNFIKEFRTRRGNAIIINDEDDKEFVQIDVIDGAMTVKMDIGGKDITIDGTDKTKTFNVIAADADMTVEVKNSLLKAGGAKVEIKSDKMTVQCAEVTVKSDGKITVNGGGKIVIDGPAVEIC
jgi:uncharacterized protein involved in type VI secretion and phage assembly